MTIKEVKSSMFTGTNLQIKEISVPAYECTCAKCGRKLIEYSKPDDKKDYYCWACSRDNLKEFQEKKVRENCKHLIGYKIVDIIPKEDKLHAIILKKGKNLFKIRGYSGEYLYDDVHPEVELSIDEVDEDDE
jgi:hypothetical protein